MHFKMAIIRESTECSASESCTEMPDQDASTQLTSFHLAAMCLSFFVAGMLASFFLISKFQNVQEGQQRSQEAEQRQLERLNEKEKHLGVMRSVTEKCGEDECPKRKSTSVDGDGHESDLGSDLCHDLKNLTEKEQIAPSADDSKGCLTKENGCQSHQIHSQSPVSEEGELNGEVNESSRSISGGECITKSRDASATKDAISSSTQRHLPNERGDRNELPRERRKINSGNLESDDLNNDLSSKGGTHLVGMEVRRNVVDVSESKTSSNYHGGNDDDSDDDSDASFTLGDLCYIEETFRSSPPQHCSSKDQYSQGGRRGSSAYSRKRSNSPFSARSELETNGGRRGSTTYSRKRSSSPFSARSESEASRGYTRRGSARFVPPIVNYSSDEDEEKGESDLDSLIRSRREQRALDRKRNRSPFSSRGEVENARGGNRVAKCVPPISSTEGLEDVERREGDLLDVSNHHAQKLIQNNDYSQTIVTNVSTFRNDEYNRSKSDGAQDRRCSNGFSRRLTMPRRNTRRVSISGSFTNVDGVDLLNEPDAESCCSHSYGFSDNDSFVNDHSSKVEIFDEEFEDMCDGAIESAIHFERHVLSKIKSLPESFQLLRRTRTVAALASRLMGAPDEIACFEEVTRLLLPLFRVDQTSYALLTDPDHFIVKQVNVKKEHVRTSELDFSNNVPRRLKKSLVGICAESLEQHYVPKASECSAQERSAICSMSMNTILVTPILVNGNRFVGCICCAMEEVDAFQEHDRILVDDIAAMLGAHIYSKRIRSASENANKISRQILHSIIPPKVIEKIECFWDSRSNEYQSRRLSDSLSTLQASFQGNAVKIENLSGSVTGSTSVATGDSHSYSNCVEFEDDSLEQPSVDDSIRKKINFLNEVNKGISDASDSCVMMNSSSLLDMEFSPSTRALYAEDAKDVCIIFTDVVGFSKMSLDMAPIQVMDMLQALFHQFDTLCDKYGVMKLETIGDGYLCSTGLLEGDDETELDIEDQKIDRAKRALAMAKEMVKSAQSIQVPTKVYSDSWKSLEIRVGIHVGNVTFGVLGERMPKLTMFGTAVNMAARMEQTSVPSKIRVTRDFYELVSETEKDWEEHVEISVKNMGQVDTYLLGP